jgi:SAM-dependent methyltransferase
MITTDLQGLFVPDLVDMGDAVDPEFAGIWTAARDVNAAKVGVTQQFLDDAETYHQKYTDGGGYYRYLLGQARERLVDRYGGDGVAGDNRLILDLGSGSGNSVIPALEMFPTARVVATDISEHLLRILRDYAGSFEDGKYADRLSLVCMDATRPYLRPGQFDLVIGAAILHHLVDPVAAITSACHALKPGGHALFFEPFENGFAILRLAYTEILGLGESKGLDPEADDLLCRLILDYQTRAGSDKSDEIFQRIDDKWLFTRGYFEESARRLGVRELRIDPLHRLEAPFSSQTLTNLKLGLGRDRDGLPGWAWDVLAKYDAAFSPELKRELLLEGCVTLTK